MNIFQMEKQHGEWKISNHDHNDLFMFEQSKHRLININNVNDIHTNIDIIFNCNENIDNVDDNNLAGVRSLPAETHYYNKTAAVNYVYNYANNPNTSQFYYISSADCTNFVSQVLWRGG